MGMDADVIAIGPFKAEIKDYLDYPPHYYDEVPDGTKVLSTLFPCVGVDQSNNLAEIFGFDAWDFSKHLIDCSKIDLDVLED